MGCACLRGDGHPWAVRGAGRVVARGRQQDGLADQPDLAGAHARSQLLRRGGTPTPSGSATPKPSPTPTPSASASPSGTAIANASATPCPSPTATTSPSPSATAK